MQTIYLVSRRANTYANETKSLMTTPDWAYVKEGDILYKRGANGTAEFKVLKTAYPINNDCTRCWLMYSGSR